MSFRRSPQSYHAEPDASHPPPPPYVPFDASGRPQSQAPPQPQPQPQAQVAQVAHQQYYAPPSHPPPPPPAGAVAMPTGPSSALAASAAPRPAPPSGHARRQGSVSETATQMASRRDSQGPGREDPLDFLRSFDTIFIVDDSASMQVNEMPDGSMGKSRWEEARDAVSGVVELASKYDEDGVDVFFLNDERSLENCRDSRQVMALFDSIEPNGTTPTGTRLEILLLEYMDQIEEYKDKGGKEPKKRNYIIITDGVPTDDPESVIVACARRLDQRNFPLAQIGIQFIQVGNDAEATEALEDLDDALSKEHGIRDMVDTVTYSSMVLNADLIIKALLGGVNRRLDRKKDRRAA